MDFFISRFSRNFFVSVQSVHFLNTAGCIDLGSTEGGGHTNSPGGDRITTLALESDDIQRQIITI